MKEKNKKNNYYDFIQLISHQMQTPLTYSKWALELIIDEDELNEKYKKQLENIYSSIAHLVLFIGDLSNFAKIETGEIIANKKPINALDVINDYIQMLQMVAKAKNQKIIISEQSKPMVIQVDPVLIGEAIKNLLDNAIKYGKENSNIEITVRPDGKKMCIVAIRNYGSVIPKIDSKKIFSKFYRGKNAKKTTTQGNGIGLFVARALTEANGGKIWYESKADKGTTFYLAIPVNS